MNYTPDRVTIKGACRIIGGDQLPKLHLWKDIVELAKLVEFMSDNCPSVSY